MYNKLKQGFIGKTMKQQQIVKWERARSKGRAMFVARFTLLCGTITFVVNSLGQHYLMGVPFSARGLLVIALIWFPYGFLAGLIIWSTNEKKYRESLNAK